MIYEIPHIEQDGGERRRNYWKKRTCGLACLKMFLEHVSGTSPSFDELIAYENEEFVCLSFQDGSEKRYPFFTPASGWIHYGLISIARRYGFFGVYERGYTKDNLVEKLEEQMKSGYFIIASTNRKPEYNGKRRGHLVVISGIEKIGKDIKIIVNDPARKKGMVKIRLKTFINNFNWSSILLSTNNEERFSSNYPTYIDKKINGNRNLLYINVHENETVAYDETLKHIRKKGGILIGIHQNKERFLRFEITDRNGKKIYLRVDPNRIFDDRNLEKTIVERNSHMDISLLPIAKEKGTFIRDYILKSISGNSVVVGVHTNKLLDINNFKDTDFIHKNSLMPKNAFIQVTTEKDFQILKKMNMNCLYYPDGESDGSLSDYCQRNSVRHFTLETGSDDAETFSLLLESLDKLLENELILQEAHLNIELPIFQTSNK